MQPSLVVRPLFVTMQQLCEAMFCVQTIRNVSLIQGLAKLVEALVLDVFAAANEAQQTFDIIVFEGFPEVTQGASIGRDA